MADERRHNPRRKFAYYMRVADNSTLDVIGDLTDISPHGFKLDRTKPPVPNKDYTMRLDLTPEISDRSFIIFVARSKWSNLDPTDPNSFIEGFQLMNISPHDQEIFNRIVEKYGAKESSW